MSTNGLSGDGNGLPCAHIPDLSGQERAELETGAYGRRPQPRRKPQSHADLERRPRPVRDPEPVTLRHLSIGGARPDAAIILARPSHDPRRRSGSGEIRAAPHGSKNAIDINYITPEGN